MLSFPGALFRFSRLIAALTSVGRMGEEEYLRYIFEYARRAVIDVVWCYIGWYRTPHTSWSSCPGRVCTYRFLLAVK